MFFLTALNVIIFSNFFDGIERHRFTFTFNRPKIFLMKKIAVLFLGLLMGIANVGVSPAHAGTTATLSLSPTNTSVETGDSFSLSVLVDANDESLDTVRVDLSFDPDLVEITSFDLGSLFPNLSPSNDTDNDAGTLSYGAYKFGTPVTSSGTLATVTFHALSEGTATIEVESTSRLISDGEETLDTGDLGSATITISGEDVASEAVEEEEEESDDSSSGATESDEAAALVYFGALFGRLPSSDDDWETNDCIANDGCYDSDNRNLTYEVAALAKFNSKYGANPSSSMDWQAVHALAYTAAGQELLGLDVIAEADDEEEVAEVDEVEEVVEEESEASLEQQALVYFGAFYARMPSSDDDWSALHCIAYGGCQGDPRDVAAEQAALVIFGAKYAKMPSTDMEWNVIHTLAYTDFLDEGDEGEEVAEVEEVDEVVEEESEASLEQQALVYFGAFYARMPSSDDDWSALHCIAYGGCKEDPQDVAAEQAALVIFGAKYAKMPSTDMEWNVIHTLAYTDFLDEGGEEEVVEEEVVEEEAAEETELTLEQQAIGWFGTITGRLPSEDADWVAIDYMVNGYTPSEDERDLEAESAAITTYVDAFGALPSSDQDWNIVAAIAYSGAF